MRSYLYRSCCHTLPVRDVYKRQVVHSGIAALGALVLASGYAGTFIYGLLERALIPFGLHHVFYICLLYTSRCV